MATIATNDGNRSSVNSTLPRANPSTRDTTMAPTSSSETNGGPSRSEIQRILGDFDAKINQMMDYPAKDIINALTMGAERHAQYAPEIVSFLETKIHRAPPNYKLPIFYLTDSILKNVRGQYVILLARNIVPLYCNCVKQVSGKDLRRFAHVLNTWETSRLFAKDALATMRIAADRALANVDPTALAQPVSFANEPPPQRIAAAQPPKQSDMELRSLLTQMQNDMGIHPTEHLTLEQVRVQNPEWYNQLVEYHAAASQQTDAPPSRGPAPSSVAHPVSADPRAGLLPPPAAPAAQAPRRDPRSNTRFSSRPAAPPAAPAPAAAAPAKSANAAHLMELLKRKKRSPPPSPPRQHEYHHPETPAPSAVESMHDDQPRPVANNAASVLSILKKLKGLNGNAVTPVQSQQHAGPPQPSHDRGAASMWFSDKIVAHKDRVESNIQKLYAALPLICRESGLRFREQSKFDAHLDFLFRYNRAQKERGKGGISRSWYPDEAQWISDSSGDVEPRSQPGSSFFDQKPAEEVDLQASYDEARVPVDESVTRCRICGENFAKSWDEEEEDWMYINAVYGTIHTSDGSEQQTIFHKYCYDTVMANSKHITPEHLIPGTPQALKPTATMTAGFGAQGGDDIKRRLDDGDLQVDSDDDDDDDDRRIPMKSE